MTEEELNAIVTERGVMIKAINIRPYMYSLPCSVGKGPTISFILNEMCCRGWTSDGRIDWMLESHNFFFAKPDDMIEVVPVPKGRYTDEYYERAFALDANMMNKSRSKGR